MNVTHVMKEIGSGISQTATISEAAVMMRDEQTDLIPVFEGERLVGVITDREIVTRGVVSGRDAGQIRVSEVMTIYLETVSCDAGISEVAQRMQENQIQTLFVVDQEGNYLGVVSWKRLWGVSDVYATPVPAQFCDLGQ